MNKKKIKLVCCSCVILWTALMSGYFLFKNSEHNYVFNFTSSLPGYLYKKVNLNPQVDDLKKELIVEVCLAKDSKAYKIDSIIHKIQHGSCKSGRKPFIKIIGALEGDYLKADGHNYLTVNNRQIIGTKPANNKLPVFKYDNIVPKDQVLIYTPNINSLDSRYFGFINYDEIVSILEEVF